MKWVELASGAQGPNATQESDPTPTVAFWLLLAFASAGSTLLVIRLRVSRTDSFRGHPRSSRVMAQGRKRQHDLNADDDEETMSLAPSFVLRDLASRAEEDEHLSTTPSFVLRDMAGRAQR